MGDLNHRASEASALVLSAVLQRPDLAPGVDARDIASGPLRDLLTLIQGRIRDGRPTDHAAIIATANGDLTSIGGSQAIEGLVARGASPGELGRYLAEARRFAVLRAVLTAAGREDLEGLRRSIAHLDDEIAGEEAFVQASMIEETQVEWLWDYRIPRRGVTFLTGPRGKGKSICTTAIAAAVSRGHGFLPADPKREPGRVVFVNVEDPPDSVSIPRLRAAGADLELVDVWRWGQDGIVLPNNVAALRRHVERQRPMMVILDPVTAMIRPGLDPYKPTDVFQIMRPLQELAEEYDVSVMCVAHPPKNRGGEGDAAGYVAGSFAWEAAARSILLFAPPPDSDPKTRDRLIAQGKSSWAEAVPPVLVRVGPHPAEPSLPVLSWVKELEDGEVDADEVAAGRSSTAKDRTRMDEAVAFLKTELAGGDVLVAEVGRNARGLDISSKTLERARKALGVTAVRTNSGGVRGKGHWVMRLPRAHPASAPAHAMSTPPMTALNDETPGNPLPVTVPIERHSTPPMTALDDEHEEKAVKDFKARETAIAPPEEANPAGAWDTTVIRIHRAYLAARILNGGTGRYDLDRQGRAAIIQAVEATDAKTVEDAVQGWRYDDWTGRGQYLAIEQLLGGPRTGVKVDQIERFARLEAGSMTVSPSVAWGLIEGMRDVWPTATWTPKVERQYLEAIARGQLAAVAAVLAEAEGRGDREPPPITSFDHERLT